MKINKKKFIYLISPNKVIKNFYKDLKTVLNTNKVYFFQMRLKNYSFKEKIMIGVKLKKICKEYNVKFIVNDDPSLAKKINADGCHLGQNDMRIEEARSIIGNKIIGVTCHNSIRLAKSAIKLKANYLAFGAFYSTKTKKVRYRASTKILNKVNKITNLPIVAIGGINNTNYKKLLLNKANFLAISGYVWKNKKFKPLKAVRMLR